MVSSAAATVEAYLAELPPERRAVVATVRALVNAHLPEGYVEGMHWGMIGWVIPLSRYPVTYNKQPLIYAALAAQKNNYALYLMCAYSDSQVERDLRAAYAAAGLKLDMGKSCSFPRTRCAAAARGGRGDRFDTRGNAHNAL